MAPLLIDSRDLVKLGFISLLVTLAVFVAGFLSGYQQATIFYATGIETESLLLPKKVAAAESAIEPLSPEVIEAGEDVDVDHPKARPEVVAIEKINAEITHASQTAEQSLVIKKGYDPMHEPLHENANGSDPVVEKSTVKAASVKTKGVVKADQSDLIAVADSAELSTEIEPEITALTSAELKNIKYSIQVGMYGRLINAENMMRMLQAQQLNAYVSDYSNSKKEVRYNVRFGYFVDKKSALAALRKYKNKKKGDGYLVKFSVESITDLAEAENIVQPAKVQHETIKQKEEIITPDSVSSDAMTLQTGRDVTHLDKSLMTFSVIPDVQI